MPVLAGDALQLVAEVAAAGADSSDEAHRVGSTQVRSKIRICSASRTTKLIGAPVGEGSDIQIPL